MLNQWTTFLSKRSLTTTMKLELKFFIKRCQIELIMDGCSTEKKVRTHIGNIHIPIISSLNALNIC